MSAFGNGLGPAGDTFVLGGVFFVSLQAIARNDKVVQETFSQFYQIVSSN